MSAPAVTVRAAPVAATSLTSLAHATTAFEAIVRNGRMGATQEMPFFKPSWLNDDDLRRSYAFLTHSPLLETMQCEPPPVPSAAEISDASARGLAVWRAQDGKTDPAGIISNVACADCHAPDPLDLAYYGFQDGNILRRGTAHLPAAKIADVVDMVHALRAPPRIDRSDRRTASSLPTKC